MSFLKNFTFWILLVIIILVGLVGFIMGKLTSPASRTIPRQAGITNTLFTSQTASIRGYVVDVSDKKLKVQNLVGVTGEVEVNDNLLIKKPESKEATPTSNLKDVELRREALIALDLVNGGYKVMTITYLPKLPNNFR